MHKNKGEIVFSVLLRISERKRKGIHKMSINRLVKSLIFLLTIFLMGGYLLNKNIHQNLSININKDNTYLLEDINILDYTERYIKEIEKENKTKKIKHKSVQKLTSRGEISRRPIYDFNNLTVKSNVTEEFLKSKLEGTPLYNHAMSYIKAEKEFGINALFLCAISIQESGWGESRLAKEKNNLFGYAAYNDNPYSSAKQFSSVDESILIVGEKLANNYLNENGKYYNGKSIDAVNTRYSLNDDGTINKDWGNTIKLLMKQLCK